MSNILKVSLRHDYLQLRNKRMIGRVSIAGLNPGTNVCRLIEG